MPIVVEMIRGSLNLVFLLVVGFVIRIFGSATPRGGGDEIPLINRQSRMGSISSQFPLPDAPLLITLSVLRFVKRGRSAGCRAKTKEEGCASYQVHELVVLATHGARAT